MRYALFLIFAAALVAQPYHGTVNGTITFGADGASGFGPNYIQLPANTLNTACITVEAWGNASDVSAGWAWVLNNVTGSTPTIALGHVTGGAAVAYSGSGFASGGTVTTGTYVHLAMQQCSDVVTIYVNGVQRATGPTTGPYASTAVSRIGVNMTGGEPWIGSIRHLTIWNTARYAVTTNGTTVFTPAPSYTGSEGMRAYYPLTANALDATGAPALAAGGLSQALGLFLSAPSGGTSPYSYQLQSYSGACSSGTFANDGAALTGQTSTALFARADATTKCYRVVVTDAASATSNSNSVTAPTTGGGMRSY